MTLDQYNTFCGSLPATSHVVQWGGAHVWKVGSAERSKVFVVGGWISDKPGADMTGISFKVSDIGWEVLCDAPGCRPAPYLASRGMKWIQMFEKRAMRLAELKAYLKASHALVAAGLPRKVRAELGLGDA